MGRLRVIQSWSGCTRCERHRHRLGVFAPEWPVGTRVVVLTTAADRASQIAQVPSPVLLRKLERMREALRLYDDECVGDVLLACGMGDPTPDDVAACSARIMANVEASGPEVIVFESVEAKDLAFKAGLLDATGQFWEPIGGTTSVPVYVTGAVGAQAWEQVIRKVGRRLRIRPTPRAKAASLPSTAAADLLAVLGRHLGHGIRGRSRSSWVRRRSSRLTVAQVQAHLDGHTWIAPFDALGDWSFVVVDVDRHHALAEKHFEKTLKGVLEALPGAFVMQSSPSKGAHVYVRVPPGYLYRTAALIVLVHLTAMGLRWRTVEGEDADDGPRSMRFELLEVPMQPVRLPFGRGSHEWGSTLPRDQQFARFLSHVKGIDFAAFEAAVANTKATMNLRGHEWEKSKRERMKTWLKNNETAELVAPDLPVSDPFATVVPLLSKPVGKVAAAGVPAMGTRTRWTVELIAELADIYPPQRVRELVMFWLTKRAHKSEDLEVRRPVALAAADKQLESFYRKRRGVPVRFWHLVEQKVRAAHAASPSSRCSWACRSSASAPSPACSSPCSAPRSTAPSTGCSSPCSSALLPPIQELLQTAFFLLLRFYGERQKELGIGYRYFERVTGANTSKKVREFMLKSGWMSCTMMYSDGNHPSIYKLDDSIWPPNPSEAVLFAPP